PGARPPGPLARVRGPRARVLGALPGPARGVRRTGLGRVAGLVGARGSLPVADRVPRGLGRLLLCLFLGPPLAGPVYVPAHLDRGTEGLLMVGAALLDVVLRHAEDFGRGEFL